MPIEKDDLEQAVKQAFPDAIIKIIDLVGDKDHYSLEVASDAFIGKSLIEQHKMVNNALKFCIGTTLHALKIKTSIPS